MRCIDAITKPNTGERFLLLDKNSSLNRVVTIRHVWRRLIIRKIIAIDDYIVFFLFYIVLS